MKDPSQNKLYKKIAFVFHIVADSMPMTMSISEKGYTKT